MRHSSSALAVLFAGAVPLAAQTPVFDLDAVVISGGLTPVQAQAYGRAHTVVTARDIEERGLRSVQDALRAVPGLSVSSTGTSLTQIRIRGGEARHTLILIDGIPAKGGDDEYQLTGLETANIERIEVLRGPQSVLYGSNASAGVVNIITRKGVAGTQHGGSVELGNGASASAFVSTRGARGGLAFNLSHRDDKGYDYSGTPGGEKDGIRRTTLGLSGDVQATEDLRLGFTLRRAKERFDYDATNWAATSADTYVLDDPTLTTRRDERTGEVFAELDSFGGRLTHRLAYQESVFRSGMPGAAPTTGTTKQWKYRATLGLDGLPVDRSTQRLSLAIDRRKDASSLSPADRRGRRSVALEYQGEFFGGLDVQAGVRRDFNDVFADATTWSVGLSYTLPDSGIRFHGSAGAGSVNPSYYNLFANDPWTLGNPNLAPERNRGFDIGVEAQFLDGRGVVDVTLFRETLTDKFDYVNNAAADGSGRATYRNLAGRSPRKGIEVSGRLQATDALSLGMNYTYTDSRGPNGQREVRRPRHEFGLSATHDIFGGRGSVTADLRHVAGQLDTQFWLWPSPNVVLPNYTTLNLSARYDLTDNVALTGRIVNVTNRKYSDVWGYASPGRTAHIGLQAKW